MKQDHRTPFEAALRRAREAAGGYAGQESFMTAGEIRSLAVRAGIGPGVSVLDVCCGTAGPGTLIARELGCAYLGVDASASAVALARERAGDLPCRFAVAAVPPLPDGEFDVVLLLETMLAFADKDALVRAVAAALRPGGRFAFTLEEGAPLTAAERAAMPDADTVWLTPVDELAAILARAGLGVTWVEDHSRAHRAQADALLRAFAADRAAIAAVVGERALDELLAAHELWVRWLDSGRVRKLAVVAGPANGSWVGERSLQGAVMSAGAPAEMNLLPVLDSRLIHPPPGLDRFPTQAQFACARAPRRGSPPPAAPARTPTPARARRRPPRAAAPPRP